MRPDKVCPAARRAAVAGFLLVAGSAWLLAAAQAVAVPPDQRGDPALERMGLHGAGNIRTLFWNYGMIGDFPADPTNVDLHVFHSVEVPIGSGMNYSHGITPFILARVVQSDGSVAYIMETGFRERQGTSPYTHRVMRFEPRPGYFQVDPNINVALSPAMSDDPRTWPPSWPDRLNDPTDPGWAGEWDGFFGKGAGVARESYMVLDDQAYDAWPLFVPDQNDFSRHGLALRIDVRSLQWPLRLAENLIFWHYDIANEGTTDYVDNVIFGVYMDPGIGGASLSCDGINETDDDNAFIDGSLDEMHPDLVYTWDNGGHGVDLSGPCGRTGYLGCCFLQTSANPSDGLDNDLDGLTDESQDSGPGQRITGQEQIRAYVAAHDDLARFEYRYGPLEGRPAYRAATWWTGDEDLDWTAEDDDLGADGLPGTGDPGEGDEIPSAGEPQFDARDLHEADQLGLTGFKLNRIRPGPGNPDSTIDDVVFYTNDAHWPQRLWDQFTAPDPVDRFEPPVAGNWDLGVLMASGPFRLAAGETTRFSLALAYGYTLTDLRQEMQAAHFFHDGDYQMLPVAIEVEDLEARATERTVVLSWRLSEAALGDVAGVHVERAESEQGPFARRTGAALEPSKVMSFEDTRVEAGRAYWYRLELIGRDDVSSTAGPVRVQTMLLRTTVLDVETIAGARGPIEVRYRIARDATPVSIHIYDVRGRDVRELEHAVRDAGEYRLAWDRAGAGGVPVARGVYLVRLTAGATTITKRVVIVRN